MNEIVEDGKIVTKIGMPGEGMTHESILILEELQKKGYQIHTNIRWRL